MGPKTESKEADETGPNTTKNNPFQRQNAMAAEQSESEYFSESDGSEE